jgi:hypothetical protein
MSHTIVRGHFGQGFSSFNFGIAHPSPAFDSPAPQFRETFALFACLDSSADSRRGQPQTA